MKNLKLALIGAIVVVTIVAFLVAHGTKDTHNTAPAAGQGRPNVISSSVSSGERITAKKTFLKAIRMVADKTGDKEAKGYASFAEANAVAAEPVVADGNFATRILEEPAGKDWFTIMPILAEDKKVPGIKAFAEDHFKSAIGGFEEKSNSICFNSTSEISDAWLGILMLHELRHTAEFHTQPYDPDKETDQEYCCRERDTHEFENRLISKYFGSEYDKYVAKQSEQMFQTLEKSGDLEKKWPGQEGMENLPPLFAGSGSRFAEDAARTQIWVDCVFHYIDAHHHGDANEKERKKAVFLSNLYVQCGIRKSPN